MPEVRFRTVQVGGGGCLARLIGVAILLVIVVAIAAGLVLLPIIMAVAFVLATLWSLVRRPAGARRACPACGLDLTGQGDRGACPKCGTLFGFDVASQPSATDHPRAEPPSLPPP